MPPKHITITPETPCDIKCVCGRKATVRSRKRAKVEVEHDDGMSARQREHGRLNLHKPFQKG